jgi:hypothetical protein
MPKSSSASTISSRRSIGCGDHAAGGHPLSDDDAGRLADLEVGLDQCWDLLRQRRARREFGQDPDRPQPRDPSVVERYLQ